MMRRILRYLTVFLGLYGALQALGQTPVPLPVQGNLGSISGSGVPYAGIDVQLQNCPSPVSITGYFGIIQQQYQVMADPSGNINTTVWPNDLITCNGTTGNSQYNLSLVLNGVVQGTPQCYQVVSTQGLWNLTTQQPITCSQPAPNPQDATYNNLTVNGFFQAHNGAFSGTLSTLSTATKQSPHVDITWFGASPTATVTTNDTAISAAITFQSTFGGDIFTPTGVFTVGQMFTVSTGVCFQGQSELGSVWQLHTTTNVNAVLFINGGSHNCVRDMTITTDTAASAANVTIADLYVLDDAQGDYEHNILGSANSTTGSSLKILGGVNDKSVLNTTIADNWPAGSLPAYGQYYGQDGAGRCSCPMTIDSPTLGGGAIANFYANNLQQTTITGMQNSGGVVSTDIQNSLDVHVGGLVSESATGSDGVIVNASHNVVFDGATTNSSAANFHIEASFGTVYKNSAVASPILIDSTARGTVLDGLELDLGTVYAPDITNSSPDLKEGNFTDSFGNAAVGSVPKFCSELGGSSPPGTLSGFLAPVISNTGYTPLCQNAVGAPTYWSAIFDGTWQQGGCGGAGLPRIIEINQASPTITCGSQVITVSIQSGVLSAKETTGTGNVLFSGWMTFYSSPNASGAAGTSEWLLGAIEADGGLIVGGNTVVPSKSTGFHGTGSGDVKVQMSDGSGTSTHLATFNSTGGLTDGGAAQPASVSGTLTYTTATSDAATVTGATASSHCTFSPTNATAAAATVLGYISAITTSSVTITHVATTANGGTVDIVCTVN